MSAAPIRRKRASRVYRTPILLAGLALLLAVFGFTQLNTPLTTFAVFGPTATFTPSATPTHTQTSTATPSVTPTRTPTSSTTPTSTDTPSPTEPPTATPTSTASTTPTVYGTVAAPDVSSRNTRTEVNSGLGRDDTSPFPTTTGTIEPSFSTPTAPTANATPVVRTARVPILMYHHVGDLPPGSDAIQASLTLPAAQFEAQMRYIADQGYTPIRIADLVNYLQNGAELPPKPIILTFDDGYADNYVNVFPTLKDYGFVGTFFIVGWRTEFNSEGYLTWEQIQELAQNGMEIGSHSLTHRYNLGTIRPSAQETEIVEADKIFRQRFPDWLPIFSYPSGSYNQTTLDILKGLGYVASVTTKQGTFQSSETPLELRRIRIRGEWSISQFVYWFEYWASRP